MTFAVPGLDAAGACAPIHEGLIGWWSAEGNAADHLGQHDGTNLGATFVAGVRGQAFQFDGINSRVNVADSPAFELTQSLTIEGWLNINTFLGAQIFFRGDNRPGLDPFSLSAEPGQRVAFLVLNEAQQYDQIFAPVPANQWIHVAAVLNDNDGTMKIYVNGSVASERTTTVRPFASLDPAAQPGIGIGNHGGTFHNFPFNGLIDEIALYGRALSAQEIQAIYQAGAAGKCPLPEAGSCTLETLIERVESSDLPSSRKRPLLATLRAAALAFEHNSRELASSLLRVFQRKVHSQLGDSTLADGLIGCAQEVIDSLAEPAQCLSRVLFGPTRDEIVVQVKTSFKVPDAPNFDRVCVYQSAAPHFWEVDMVGLQSPFFGYGSPGLAISFFSAAIEENLSLFIPNSYITNRRAFRVTSNPVLPPDGVDGVRWTVGHSESFPMSYLGYVTYDRYSNVATVDIVFRAGTPRK